MKSIHRSPRFSAALFQMLVVGILCFLGINRASAEAPRAIPGAYSLVVLPDTQFYAQKFQSNYLAQTEWIAANTKRYNISYVLHVGDVTQDNVKREWELAVKAHDKMKGVVPWIAVPGNHDLGSTGRATSRESLMSKYFSAKEFRQWPTFGGLYDKEPGRTENSFHLFEAGGRKWLILGLEFGPRHDVLRWANEVVAKHADRSVILVTHAYLRPDNTRYNRWLKLGPKKNAGMDSYKLSKDPAGYNDGEDVWNKLVSKHANFSLVFSGHVCYTGLLSSKGEKGNTVHQILVDYQRDPTGGNGYLRLLQFHSDGKTVKVQDYSPVLDQASSQPKTNYELTLDPAPRN